MIVAFETLSRQLHMLADVIENLSDEQYVRPVAFLSGSSIGQHSRHVVELLQCLVAGYSKGMVNYDNRRRSKSIEENRRVACEAITELLMAFSLPDKPMIFEACLDDEGQTTTQVQTTYHREIVYNIEHAIHHMALIKVGLFDLGVDTKTVEAFGVAYATMQYRKACAQ